MRMTRVAPLFLVTTLMAAGGLGCRENTPPPDPELLFSNLDQPAVTEWSEHGTARPASLAAYGEGEGLLAFGHIIGVAVRHDGVLAIADLQDCSITLLRRPGGQFLERFGRCGSGPAEFQQLFAIAFHGDSLLAYDRGTNLISVLDATGNELGRVRLELPPTSGINKIAALDDTTIVAALERARTPDMAGESTLDLVGLISLRSGRLRDSFAAEVPKAFEGSQNVIRRADACLHRGSRQPLVVVLNNWSFEGVGFELPRKREAFHFLTNVPIEPGLARAGYWTPGAHLPGVECGASGALFKMSRRGPPEPGRRPAVAETYLQFRSYDGRLRFATSVTEAGSPLHGRFGAMRGDTLFVFGVDAAGHPAVTEYVFR
jgi:hypothetical protein